MEKQAVSTTDRDCQCGEKAGWTIRRIDQGEYDLEIKRQPAYKWVHKDGSETEGYPGGPFCYECAKRELERRLSICSNSN